MATPEPATIPVQITAVIEREFKRRAVFPELRLELASSVVNGAAGIYIVTADCARAILADARTQRSNRDLPRGLPKAFTALVRSLERLLGESLDGPNKNDRPSHDCGPDKFRVGQLVAFVTEGDGYGWDRANGEIGEITRARE
jgi:hypothetical protein